MSEYETQEKIDSLLENYFFFIESKSMNTDEKYSLAEKYLYQEKNQEDDFEIPAFLRRQKF